MADEIMDPLQAALTEAEAFMNELSVSNGDAQGFSIDSDEEEIEGGEDDDDDEACEDVPLNAPPVMGGGNGGGGISSSSHRSMPWDDPLSLAAAEAHTSHTPQHPLVPLAPTSVAPPLSARMQSSLQPSLSHTALPSSHATTTQSQAVPTYSTTTTTIPSSSLSPPPVASVPSSSSSSSSSANPTMDAFKQQTSRFASNLAHMAQRAANQIGVVPTGATGSTATTTTTTTTAMTTPTYVLNTQQQAGRHHLYPQQQQTVGTTATQTTPNAIAGTTTVTSPFSSSSYPSTMTSNTYLNGMASQPPATPIASSSGLDKEQQAALIQTHVGDLLPGEKVIMFLSNLLHVSDSTGFSYSQTMQPSTLWCCAMTYYRLLLFGTHPSRPPSKPHAWHASCWPHRSVHLLQIPLASMEKVEKSVFTAQMGSSTGNHGGNGNNSNSNTTPNNGTNGNNNNMNGGTGLVPGLNGTGYTSSTNATTTLMGVQIQGKDNRLIRFTTTSYAETMRAYEALQTYAFPGRRNIGYLFAFESKKEAVMQSVENDPVTGQPRVTLPPIPQRFHGVEEFQRQFDRLSGTAASTPAVQPWSIYTQINAQYQLCASYPSILAGPASIDETKPESFRILQQSATFRSEQRLPALTWSSGVDGASLWRASQPKIGLQGNRSAADELLMKHIQEQAAAANQISNHAYKIQMPVSVLAQLAGVSPYHASDVAAWMSTPNCDLKILDLRPRASAMANRTAGYGYENTSNYPGTTLQFCNIGNIHAVRDAHQKISNLCLTPSAQDLNWPSLVEDTRWMSSIRVILAASWETAFWIHVHRLPVLLHCSHGWDRTSQVAVIAQLLLDPYYRTCKGFACLVEKDFMAFGHPFHTRCAHGEGRNQDSSLASSGPNHHDEGQVSPIFIQFLDAAFQVVNQYPEAFEFNTKYLLCISDHLYSCRFGNFLCDTERERERVAGLRQRTHSLWDYLDETAAQAGLLNPTFDASENQGALLMPLPNLLRNVTLWVDRHARYGPGGTTQRW